MPHRHRQHTYNPVTLVPPLSPSWVALLYQGKDRFQQVEYLQEQAEVCQEQANQLELAARAQVELADREVREALHQQAWEDYLQAAQEAEVLWAVEKGLAHLELWDQEAPLEANRNHCQGKTRHQDKQVRFLLPMGH